MEKNHVPDDQSRLARPHTNALQVNIPMHIQHTEAQTDCLLSVAINQHAQLPYTTYCSCTVNAGKPTNWSVVFVPGPGSELVQNWVISTL